MSGNTFMTGAPNKRIQSDFGKLRLPRPLMRALCGKELTLNKQHMLKIKCGLKTY
jgi:hypothetical protein